MVVTSTYNDYCSKRGTPVQAQSPSPMKETASTLPSAAEEEGSGGEEQEQEHERDGQSHSNKVRRVVRGGDHTRVSRHENTIAEQLPCMSEADCEMHSVCDNRVRRDLVEVMIYNHLYVPVQDNGVAREQKGLFFLTRRENPMKEETWLTSFGQVVANDGAMLRALG